MNYELKPDRRFIVSAVLIAAIGLAFVLPKPRYQSPDIIPSLEIPYETEDWDGKDFSQELDLGDERFNFVSDILARLYQNKYYEQLLLIVLDAGNFHHPRVCFGASGFEIRELNDTVLTVQGRTFKAKTMFTSKNQENFLLLFWMCIDKKNVDWTRQKFTQFWYSLFNKQKTGLMVRLDIPLRDEKDIPHALARAAGFLTQIGQDLPQEQLDYLFGRR